ncbi:MAG: glycosyltransferase family 39 protein [Planctomycetes bacterium]|nr:glycosyltransferase family 39 protein [Planctomycetota bacterium]
MPDSRPNSTHLLLVSVLAAVLFFAGLGRPRLRDPDETRYVEIPREMLESGNFIVPHLNYLPYLDKPPLTYWMTCAGFKIFGMNEFGARFFPALAGLAGVVAIYLFGCVMFGEGAGFRAAIVLCTSAFYFYFSRMLLTDMILTLFVTLATGFLYLSWKRGARWLIPAYVCMALGTLTKGPVGVLLPMAPIALLVLTRQGVRGVKSLVSIGAVLAFLIIWAPWHMAIYFAAPEFFPHFYLSENILGFFRKGIHHSRPPYYTICYLLLGFLPWTLFLPATLEKTFGRHREHRDASTLCLLWMGSTVLIFTLSVSKLPTYVLPAFAPLALLVGSTIPRSERPSLPTRIVACLLGAGLCVAVVIVVVVLSRRYGPQDIVADLRNMSIMFLLFTLPLTAVLARSAGKLAFTLGVLSLPFQFASLAATHSAQALEFQSGREIAKVISERGDLRELTSYCEQYPNLSLYFHRRQLIVGYVPRQFEFGLSLSPEDGLNTFISARKLALMASRQPGVYCIVRGSKVAEFDKMFHYYFRLVSKFEYDSLQYLFVSTGKPSPDAPSVESLPDWPTRLLRERVDDNEKK